MYTSEQMFVIDCITTGINMACAKCSNYTKVLIKTISDEDADVVVEYFQNKGMRARYLKVFNGTIFWLVWEVCL